MALELDRNLRVRFKLDRKEVIDVHAHLPAIELNLESDSAVEIALHHYKARVVDFSDRLRAALAGWPVKFPFTLSTAFSASWRSDTLPPPRSRETYPDYPAS